MADLTLFNRFTVELNGSTFTGKQGEADSDPADGHVIDIDQGVGGSHTLATATARTIWDEDEDHPTGFEFFFFWSDQDCYVQVIGSAVNYTQKVDAYTPFTLSSDRFLAAADTTAMSGAEPAVGAVDSIVIQNNSGTTMNYVYFVGETAT